MDVFVNNYKSHNVKLTRYGGNTWITFKDTNELLLKGQPHFVFWGSCFNISNIIS